MENKDKKLILFDIDGILIKSAGLGLSSEIIRKHFGLEPVESRVYIEGKTWRYILAEKLKERGIKDPERDPRFNVALHDTLPLEMAFKKGVKLEKIEKVEDLIKLLIEKGYTIGLLTGNSLRSAKIKLSNVELDKYFSAGGYGSDAYDRHELVDMALKDVENKFKITFDKKNVFLVGDTREDIACAKKAGVKIISVATGKENLEQLENSRPDFLFKDFSDINQILGCIEEN
jgi:phosphoglycolate phosphatase-like HAD superfamily hydrolase